LAYKSGVHSQTIFKMLRGGVFTIKTLEKVCRPLGLKVEITVIK